jgi:hypothetical protein
MQVNEAAGSAPRTINPLLASLTPWYRAVTYVALFLAGIGLWILGTQGPEFFGWAMHAAWIAFAADLAIILYWQRQAQRAADGPRS